MSVDVRLVAPAVTCEVAAVLLTGAPGWAPGIAGGAALTALLLLLAMLPATAALRGLWAVLGVCSAVAALVAAVVLVGAPSRLPEAVRTAASSHAALTGVVMVASIPVKADVAGTSRGLGPQVRFRGTLVQIERAGSEPGPAGPLPVSVPVLVFAEEPHAGTDSVRIGANVRVRAALRLTEPGDSAAALLFVEGELTPVATPSWWLGGSGDLRAGFAAAADALPGDGGDLLPGLAIGDTSAVSGELDRAMKSSSLSHLTAVSGANCAIVIAAIMLLGGYAGLPRLARVALALATLLGFVLLVTPEPSVLRSAVMASITLVLVLIGRPGLGLPTLSVAVIVLLTIDPWLSRNYGFVLSVLATAGLLVLSAPLTRLLGRWMPVPLATVLAIPLAAQLACQPVLILLTPTIALYGVPANLLAAPAAPAATMLGLLGCLLIPVLPAVAGVVLQVAWLPAAWIAAVAQTVATLPGAALPWLAGVPGVLLLCAVTVLILALVLRRTDAPRSRWPAAALGLLLAVLGGYGGTVIGAGVGRAIAFPANWQIAACDIGQGDAVVVRDGNQYALVDVGPDPEALRQCLDTLKITRINLLVLTHYDLDHVGGIDAVIGHVDTALVGIPENAQDERLHARLAAGGAAIHESARGDRGTLGALRWNVLWPIRGGSTMQTGNPGSVTIAVEGRGIRSIFLGDLGEESQDAMLRASHPGPVDVVKVAHHGSADQSPALYSRLRARIGLVSVGSDNGYGHPTPALLKVLRESNTRAYRTDRQGMLVIGPSGGGGLSVWTEKHTSAQAAPARLVSNRSERSRGAAWPYAPPPPVPARH